MPASTVLTKASFYPVFTGGVDRAATRKSSQQKYLPLIFLKEKTYPLPDTHQAGTKYLIASRHGVNRGCENV